MSQYFPTLKNPRIVATPSPIFCTFSCCCSVMSHSLQSHGLQHARLLCPPLSPGVCSNSGPLSWWCYLTISSNWYQFSSVQFSCSVMSDSLQPHGLQHARPPCPSPTPGAYSNSCPLSWWCHPIISSSVFPFSSYLRSFPASGSFPMSHVFISGGQSTGVSASVIPVNIQDWFPLGWTGWISLQNQPPLI